MSQTTPPVLFEPIANHCQQPLPDWLPDESLFSLLARFHWLTGNRLASDTCRMLFGRARQGCQHDLPSYLDELVRRTSGALGDADSLVCQRTILPFYLPFKSADIAADAVAALQSGAAASLKYRLGVLSSRFRANHPLKVCPLCMECDEAMHGVTYWHLPHQYPGVWVCPRHSVPLLQSTVKATGVGRFLWHLPKPSALVAVIPVNDCAKELEASKRIASLALGLAGLPSGSHFAPQNVAQTYRSAIARMGLTTGSGRIKLAEASKSFVHAVRDLRGIPELAALPMDTAQAGGQLSRILGRPADMTHPLRHLAMIYWLYASWEDFLECYAADSGELVVADKRSKLQGQDSESKKQRLVAYLKQGATIRQAAIAIAIDFHTAGVWATEAGHQVQRRPKKLKPELLIELISYLRDGADKQYLATRFGISIGSVTRTLFTEVGLHAEWEHARRTKARQASRDTWMAAMRAMPDAGIKLVRAYAPAAYAWLYRNDRTWLQEQSKQLPRAPSVGGLRVDWDARDTWLAQQVREAALALTVSCGRKNIRLVDLYQAIPELKAKLGKLSLLPLTARAIAEALDRRSRRSHK
jgi:hypothetical protein